MADYTIVYNANGGAGTIANETATGGSPFTLNSGAEFSFAGFNLLKWNTTADCTGTDYDLEQVFASYDLEAGLTLYAVWEINVVTITFDSNGGSAVETVTEDYGTAVVAPTAPTKTGYTFTEWCSDEELTTAYTFTTMPEADITLYAKWTAKTFTVSYKANTGTGTVANGTATYDSNFTLSNGTGLTQPVGYGVISHWNTKADNSGTSYALSKVFEPFKLTANLALFAIWSPMFYWNDDGEIEGVTSYGKSLSTIVIPSAIDEVDIEYINDNAFADCDNLTTLTIGAKIKTIGAYAFVNCSSLATLTFANGSVCTYVGKYAFAATKIAAVAIPATVTVLGDYAFSNCYALATVEFGTNSVLTEIGKSCFLNDLVLATIVLPEALVTIGATAFCSCKSLISIIIPEKVEKIYYNCFKGCTAMTVINVVAGAVNHNWKQGWNGEKSVVYGYVAG